jgi:hypothetical protein
MANFEKSAELQSASVSDIVNNPAQFLHPFDLNAAPPQVSDISIIRALEAQMQSYLFGRPMLLLDQLKDHFEERVNAYALAFNKADVIMELAQLVKVSMDFGARTGEHDFFDANYSAGCEQTEFSVTPAVNRVQCEEECTGNPACKAFTFSMTRDCKLYSDCTPVPLDETMSGVHTDSHFINKLSLRHQSIASELDTTASDLASQTQRLKAASDDVNALTSSVQSLAEELSLSADSDAFDQLKAYVADLKAQQDELAALEAEQASLIEQQSAVIDDNSITSAEKKEQLDILAGILAENSEKMKRVEQLVVSSEETVKTESARLKENSDALEETGEVLSIGEYIESLFDYISDLFN